MKKITQLISAAMLLFAVSATSAQNLIPDWDANGATGAGSEANKWGFGTSRVDAPWGTANGGDVRYRDNQSYTIDGTTQTYNGRLFLYRWDGSWWGSVMSLGVTGSTGQSGITMTAGNTYTLTGYYMWFNNGEAPTYQFSYSTTPDGDALNPQDFSLEEKDRHENNTTKGGYYSFTYNFTPDTSGDYFFQIRQTSGDGSAAGTIIQLANLSLEDKGTLSSNNISNIKPQIAFNKDVLSVKTNSGVSNITVFDILGRSVLSNNDSSTISISSLQSGTYILRVTTISGEVQVVKFAK
ncbi:T9SS type A sorting domain-containing protein [Wenyingzhuangia sp. chi5]|uniref:T9SS type A sorting domain-containing protein n=1 Tax=Wenyingzhuangia gilva TaxID=3057677 RepID=A0ABT8VPX3_9FLAO|nr:T9SS type A sorting domain-containing protein [Wenyingzhuangia sp. chi5]MDO3694002.1 T9SS type A sorting domain-containing protein [Wenyingzhuangia sp. chi5]